MKKVNVILYSSLITLLISETTVSIAIEGSKSFENYIVSYADMIEDDDFLISAHRGFSSLEVENTKESISLASSKDYIDYIEIDARMTADKRLVLSHDNILLNNSMETEVISSLSYDDVLNTTFNYSSFDLNKNIFSFDNMLIIRRNRVLNNREYNVIGLREGIKYCGNKKVLLDLKFGDNIEEFSDELIRELEGIDTSNIIFQSLNINGIKYLKDNTDYNCLVLISKYEDLKYINDFENVGLKYNLVSYDLVESIINSNRNLAVWTVNSRDAIDFVLERSGKYYKNIIYISDYPDLIVTRLHEKEDVVDYQLKR